MIIMIEGPRGVGKSTLVDNYFKDNTRDDVIYYKFAFSDYIKNLGFEDQEKGPGVHYFSISNIITILEISNTILKDKHVIFDRSIFSAYVWSIFRNRMSKNRLMVEFYNILRSPIYRDCKLVSVENPEGHVPSLRDKSDIFNKYESFNEESEIYSKVFSTFNGDINNESKGNVGYKFINNKDDNSIREFNNLINSIVDK